MNYLFDPQDNPVRPATGWINIPGTNDTVGNPPNGWVHPSGFYVADYTPVEQNPAPDPVQDLNAWREFATISQFQAHYTLDVWGIYEQVEQIVAASPRPVQLAFDRAIEWRRNSPMIQQMFANITLPGGGTPTAEDLDQFFADASVVSV